MSSFIKTILAILQDETTIPGLADDEMIGDNPENGEVVSGRISRLGFVRVVRLQNLIYQEEGRSPVPSVGELTEMHKIQQKPYQKVAVDFLITSTDSSRRVEFIRRLIVEVVRDEIPGEDEKFDVEYVAGFLNNEYILYRVQGSRQTQD